MRIKRGWVVLRCRACPGQWRLDVSAELWRDRRWEVHRWPEVPEVLAHGPEA
eukprot:gene7503-9332_t